MQSKGFGFPPGLYIDDEAPLKRSFRDGLKMVEGATSVSLKTIPKPQVNLKSPLPLVTIITPAYNRASYLEETIKSVLDQGYPNLEYIVLNDGSTDNTEEVLKKCQDKIIWQTHANMGETRTVNKGLGMAHGELICILNSDDLLFPGSIFSAVEFMQSHPDILVGYPDWDFIDPDSVATGHVQVPEYDYLYSLKQHHCIVGPGAFIRRTAIELAGVRDTEFRYVADFEYWLRLGLYGKFARIPRTLASFRVHPDSATVSLRSTTMAEEHIRLIKKFYEHKELSPEILRVRKQALSSANMVASLVTGKSRRLAIKYHLRAYVSYFPAITIDLIALAAAVLHDLPGPLQKIGYSLWHALEPVKQPARRLLHLT
jgi:glycosyltransferase involved in cell wall biosynthesis